jgi:hypothetical protein
VRETGDGAIDYACNQTAVDGGRGRTLYSPLLIETG